MLYLECDLEHLLAPGIDFEDFPSMGAYMMHEMKQPKSSLATAMVFLGMKRLPEEGMKSFAHIFLDAVYPHCEIVLS